MTQHDRLAAALLDAWNGQLDVIQLIQECNHLEAGGERPLAAILYQTWLRRPPSSHQHLVNFNLGVVLTTLEDLSGAESAYRDAIALVPEFIQPRLNLGIVLERAGRQAEAVQEWRWIADHLAPETQEQREFLILALNHMGRVLEGQREYADALAHLTRSLTLDPTQNDALHHWVFLRQKQCCWPVYEPFGDVTVERMRAATSALAMIAITDDPAEQLAAAQRYIAKKVRTDLPRLAPTEPYRHRKLRIGYCSSDFSLHPVSMLMVEMLELHDREQFEVHGYCWSPEDGSELRQRVIRAFDQFHRINQLDDETAARLIRAHEIDILVDLQGQTAGARMDMLAWRPAPVQITYLGLPATTGLPSIDYVIADQFLIPPAQAEYYSERPLYMPDIYQVSDRRRHVAAAPTRASCGLPEDALVLCSFNNNFKITPEMFGVWMDLLQAVPHSVLWLLSDNRWAETHLLAEAAARGIASERLVFAGRVAPENYLARYLVADLFLDSFPFNAGTTANDALWTGLPVLTRSGSTFASRMAGALLTAAGLPELITFSLEEYRAVALSLAQDRGRLTALRERLQAAREQGVLFDTPRFVRHFEQACLRLTGADALLSA